MPSQTPQTIHDDAYVIKLNQWGLLLSVCTFGAHIALFSHCIPPLLSKKRRGYKLLAYIITLFALCTAAIGLQIWWTQVAFIDNHGYPGGPNQYLRDNVGSTPNMVITGVYIVINWLVDGLLLYRFNVLWGALWPGQRNRTIMIITASSFLAIIVTGCVFFPQIASLGLNVWTDMATAPAIAYLSLSFSFNTILTLLILSRIFYVRWTLRKSLGNHHGEIYTSLLGLIIESASLYSAVALMSVIASGLNSPIQYALLPMLGQLQAIPPLMITSRVAEGKALSVNTDALTRSVSGLEFKSRDLESGFGQCAIDSASPSKCSRVRSPYPCIRQIWEVPALRYVERYHPSELVASSCKDSELYSTEMSASSINISYPGKALIPKRFT